MSDRFYCPAPPRGGRYQLGAEEARHLARVCRLGVGDRVEIFDGRGFVTLAEVVAASAASAELIAVGDPLPVEPSCGSLILATAVPKGDRFDWIVEKATELGVERLIPIVAERSVVVPGGSKLERLRRAIVEASKQSRRPRLMALDEPMNWSRLVLEFRPPASLALLADPAGLPPGRWPSVARGQAMVLAVGPEGGFTETEIEEARESGWVAIRLGNGRLRVETAGLAGCAALLMRIPEEGA